MSSALCCPAIATRLPDTDQNWQFGMPCAQRRQEPILGIRTRQSCVCCCRHPTRPPTIDPSHLHPLFRCYHGIATGAVLSLRSCMIFPSSEIFSTPTSSICSSADSSIAQQLIGIFSTCICSFATADPLSSCRCCCDYLAAASSSAMQHFSTSAYITSKRALSLGSMDIVCVCCCLLSFDSSVVFLRNLVCSSVACVFSPVSATFGVEGAGAHICRVSQSR